jgi:NADH-quinone oxidoreductase subunit H
MTPFLAYALAFLVWPGLLVAAPLAWFELWLMRKALAKLQGRKGPPLFQPFFDWVKLMGKRTVIPEGVPRAAFVALPVIALASIAAALVVMPVPGNPAPRLPGDVVLLLYLLEVPVLCEVVAGYVGRSVYGEVGAMREALMSLAYNLPFLASVIAMAEWAGSFDLRSLAAAPFGLVHVVAGAAFLLALPARLKSNPFSIANAEHEIVAGGLIEYSGPLLGLFELAHALEIVVLTELFVILFVPMPAAPLAALVVWVAVGLALLMGLTLLAATTARLRLAQAFRFYWVWGGAMSVAALAAGLAR